jgi:hypothetical protein
MTEPHKRANRHPKYKTAYRVKNWAEYDKALRDRGDITLWISQDAIDAWTPPQTGKRGARWGTSCDPGFSISPGSPGEPVLSRVIVAYL